MAQVNTWTWRISSMYTKQDVPNQPDYVVRVTWRLAGTDGVKETDVGNNLTLVVDDNNPNFIPYSELTEQEVIGWVQSALGEEGILEYKAKVQAIIDSMYVTVPVAPEYTPLPWAGA